MYDKTEILSDCNPKDDVNIAIGIAALKKISKQQQADF